MSKVWILISEATLIRKIDGEEHWIQLWITEWIADRKEIEGDDEEETEE